MSHDTLVDGMQLISAVDDKMKQVHTRTLDVSFNELLDMYNEGELIITPDYQRLARWSYGQRSRFIETLILELPLPPIFVIESEEGVYELFDGLQRISSYLHFRGKLPDPDSENDEKLEPLVLTECDIVKELNGHTAKTLPKALDIRLRRNFVRVEVIRKESDQRLKYYMFKRLNTGGSILSDQEMRNCTVRLLGTEFNEFIIQLSKYTAFKSCIENISEEQLSRKFDQELVLRYFAFKNYRSHYVHDVADFMTTYMEKVSDPEDHSVKFHYKNEEDTFKKTFDLLYKTLGKQAFSGVNKNGTYVSRFLSYHYEAFALGIQPHLEQLDSKNSFTIKKLKEVFDGVKKSPDFQKLTTGGGKNYKKPLDDRIAAVEKAIRNVFD